MKPFLIRCSYAEATGVAEEHASLLVLAEDPNTAMSKAKTFPLYRQMGMHVDGVVDMAMTPWYGGEAVPDCVVSL